MFHIIGHRHPNTDTICATLVAAEYFRLIGEETTPYRLGELNQETKNVFNELGIELPEYITSLPSKSEIVLVDHNDFSESIDGIADLEVKAIIDHHPLKQFTLSTPVQLRFEPVCSTCSILFLMFVEQDLDISDPIAKLILAGILSASDALQSPATTEEEQEIVTYLSEDLGIDDIRSYTKTLFQTN